MRPSKYFSANQRRWYDPIVNLSEAVHLTQTLPEEVQVLIAKALNQAIDDFRKDHRADRYALSMGAEQVKGLYQASRGRRWYDENHVTRRAFNFMGTMPTAYLTNLAECILKIDNHLQIKATQKANRSFSEWDDASEALIFEENVLLVQSDLKGIRRRHKPRHS